MACKNNLMESQRCPLTPTIMETVQSMINPCASLESFGRDIYISMVVCLVNLCVAQRNLGNVLSPCKYLMK